MLKIDSAIINDFKAFENELIDHGLLIDINPLTKHQISREDHLFCWKKNPNLSYMFDEHSRISHYKAALLNRDFNFCLSDGSLIQITYKTNIHSGITYHRLCFIPCPLQIDSETTQEISILEYIDCLNSEELIEKISLSSPIRFDYDIDICDEKHAHSHLTLNKTTCRIPTYGPVSLGHFFRFIIRYFFEDFFDNGFKTQHITPSVYKKTLNQISMHELHIESSDL